MIRPLLVLSVVVSLSACATAPGIQRVSAGTTVDIASAGTQLSFQRAGGGIVRPLSHSPALQAVAQARADERAANSRLGPAGGAGDDLTARLQQAGYVACAVAENLAQGSPDIRSAIADWMASPEQRANILSAQMTQFGFAGAGDTWVLVLARPC